MFFDLTFNVKEKIISTLQACFNLSKELRHTLISDKFPEDLKKLPAIIVKNASTPVERAGVDDFIKYIKTKTGEVIETNKKGTSIKSAKLQKDHLLYCIRRPRVFKIEVLENNYIQIVSRNPLNRIKRSAPIPVIPGTKITDLIFDVEIELDNVLVPGDFSTILLIPINGDIAKLYGGLFEMEISLMIMAESTTELESIADWTMMYLWFIKKPDLEKEHNILIKNMRHTGETEIPELKNNIYQAGIDISLRSQWAWKVPIDQYISDLELYSGFIPNDTRLFCEGVPASLID